MPTITHPMPPLPLPALRLVLLGSPCNCSDTAFRFSYHLNGDNNKFAFCCAMETAGARLALREGREGQAPSTWWGHTEPTAQQGCSWVIPVPLLSHWGFFLAFPVRSRGASSLQCCPLFPSFFLLRPVYPSYVPAPIPWLGLGCVCYPPLANILSCPIHRTRNAGTDRIPVPAATGKRTST